MWIVGFCFVPKCSKSVTNCLYLQPLLTSIVAEHAELKKYFPDYTGALKLPSRQYFWTVVKTLCPVYYKDLVDSALKNR